MAHPIHLHGHYFWVLGSAANSTFPVNATVAQAKECGIKLNLENPVERDTAHLPVSGWLALRFKADNPGAWLMHCHINAHLSVSFNLFHLLVCAQADVPQREQSGMAVVFIEEQGQLPTFPESLTLAPRSG